MIATTSRKASRRTISLAKELNNSIPSARYVSRGKRSIEQLGQSALQEGKQFLLIVVEEYGNPSEIRIIKIHEKQWGYFATLKISLQKLRKESSKFKSKIELLNISVESPQLKKLVEELGIHSGKSSHFTLSEKNSVMDFLKEGKSIGPKIKIKEIVFNEAQI
ncbi:MAG: hypothetical protein AB1467_01410 [Candidatus Diapherotrites archaeon]